MQARSDQTVRAAPSVPRKLLFATVVVLVFFLAVDIVLRFVGVDLPPSPTVVARSIDVDVEFPFMRPDSELFWAPIPGFRGNFLGKTVTINSLGFRGEEVSIPKQASKRRLLCFGDSITFGYGVGDTETYAHVLGRATSPNGIEVVNCGVTGYSSYQTLRLLRRLAPMLDADVSLICVGWNDAARRPVDDLAYARRVRVAMVFEQLSTDWYLYRLVKNIYLRSFDNEWDGQPLKPRATPSQYRQNLESMAAVCRSHGSLPVFIDLPRRKQDGEAAFQSEYSDTLNDVGRVLVVPVINPDDLGLDTHLSDNSHYFIDSLHFSPAGHVHMAARIARELTRMGVF